MEPMTYGHIILIMKDWQLSDTSEKRFRLQWQKCNHCWNSYHFR